MRAAWSVFALAVVLVLAASPAGASAWDRGRARTFATLPAGASGPEGLEVDARGNVYVSTFGGAAPGQLYVFDDHGRLVRQVSVAGSSGSLLGMRFHPKTGALLVVDFGNARVLAVNPVTGSADVFMTVPPALVTNPAAGVGLNDVTFDGAGNVYVSDSFQGAVWRTGPSGGAATKWVESGRLRTSGVPPFGANGLRFNKHETALFVANTGDDTVIEIPAAPGASGPVASGEPSVFANSVNGADGLLVDEGDNLWVVANQADEIVVIDPTGKAIAKLGDFDGLRDGSPAGLLFPASARFLDGDLVVTNLSLDLRLFDGSFTSVDSRWCAQVSRHTVARIALREHGKSDRRDDDEGRR